MVQNTRCEELVSEYGTDCRVPPSPGHLETQAILTSVYNQGLLKSSWIPGNPINCMKVSESLKSVWKFSWES